MKQYELMQVPRTTAHEHVMQLTNPNSLPTPGQPYYRSGYLQTVLRCHSMVMPNLPLDSAYALSSMLVCCAVIGLYSKRLDCTLESSSTVVCATT